MNYASLYNMRSCFTVKRGGDPRDPWHRRRRRWCYELTTEEDTAAPREREGNISRINFAIGEFYVRAGSIYYGCELSPRRLSTASRPTVWFLGLRLFFLFFFLTRGPRRIGDQQFCLCSSFTEYLILARIKLQWILHIPREIWSPSLQAYKWDLIYN